MNPRCVASQCLFNVIYQGRSLTEAIQSADKLSKQDSALVKDICFGSLRWHFRLTAILNELLVKPLKKRDKDVECLLRVGLYQLIYQQTPAHAAVNETVKASKSLKKKWSKGLINGVLRTYIRKRQIIEDNIAEQEQAHYAHPSWMIKRIKKAWPEQWESILQEANQRAPMTIRVNLSKTTRQDYIARLDAVDISSKAIDEVESAIILDKPESVDQLPDFFEGECSVQDTSAQLAAYLLDCEEGMRVLDACAAPGGKTGHILERTANLELHALDNQAERLKKVNENLERLGQQAKLIEADAIDTESWFDGTLYDRILLDAPCSATGVIRRHPDVKVLRTADDIEQICTTQKKILKALWAVLKPGGKLLYATCSIMPEENEEQIEDFLNKHKDAKEIPVDAMWGQTQKAGRQILTQKHMDGFYYALLEKTNNNT